MQMHVTFEAFSSVSTPAQITHVRAQASETFKLMADDKRVVGSGWFVGRRGGYLVMEVNDPAEVMQVVGPLIDMFEVKIQPLAPWGMVQEMFDRDQAAGKY